MIINLETEHEEACSHILSSIISKAISSEDECEIEYIRSLWDNEPWERIVRRFNADGSTWHVWWMDGVRAFMNSCEEE